MATQYWDSAKNIRSLAESVDKFLYVDGKTSPKNKQLRHHMENEYQSFLDNIRESLWEEQTSMLKDMGYLK